MRSLLNAAVAGSGFWKALAARWSRCTRADVVWAEAAQELWKGLDSDTRNRRER